MLGIFGTLQFRTTVLVICIVLGATVAVAVFLTRVFGGLSKETFGTQATQSSALLSRAVADPLSSSDHVRLETLLREVSQDPSILFVCVYDDEKMPVAKPQIKPAAGRISSTDMSSVDLMIPGDPVYRSAARGVPGHVDVLYPVLAPSSDRADEQSKSPLVGYVRLGLEVDSFQRSVQGSLDIMTGVAAIVLVIAVPLGFLLVRHVVHPLESLCAAMAAFSKGDLSVRSQTTRNDEIGRLQRAFNQMADQHQSAHERIVGLNEELERRVTQRTQQLRELAARDPLTGVYNRRHFGESLRSRHGEAVRYGTELSCIMIDVDDFKLVNDLRGHHTGDLLLSLAARTVSLQLRSADVAARYGGDEFVVLLPHTGAQQAGALAERIVEHFAQAIAELDVGIPVTLSVGVASLTSDMRDDAEALVREADRAMYKAKDNGKAQIVVTDSGVLGAESVV